MRCFINARVFAAKWGCGDGLAYEIMGKAYDEIREKR
jgi:hypothetical protein